MDWKSPKRIRLSSPSEIVDQASCQYSHGIAEVGVRVRALTWTSPCFRDTPESLAEVWEGSYATAVPALSARSQFCDYGALSGVAQAALQVSRNGLYSTMRLGAACPLSFGISVQSQRLDDWIPLATDVLRLVRRKNPGMPSSGTLIAWLDARQLTAWHRCNWNHCD